LERTFVMIKPDGVQRALTGQIIGRIENKGYRLVAMKLLKVSPELAASHYAEHRGKPFYEDLLAYITSGPVVAMVWEGRGAIKGIRNLMGATNPLEADPGSIRGSWGNNIQFNLVHGSDSPSGAQREIDIYFDPAEILDYQRDIDKWM
jgi:nucleoside-diphosphate kinase